MRTYILLDKDAKAIGHLEADSLDNAYLRGTSLDNRTFSVRHQLLGEQLIDKPADWIPEEEFQANVNILNEVLKERKRQHSKFGQQNHNPTNFAAILNEEVGEANIEVCKWTFAETPEEQTAVHTRLRTELIQVAAVAVQMIACMDRSANSDQEIRR